MLHARVRGAATALAVLAAAVASEPRAELLVAEAFAAEGGAANLIADAQRKARQQDVSSAVKLLEQAIAAEPANADAHILYQDITREVAGVAPLLDAYKKRAQAAPQDPLFAFLLTRLQAPDQAVPEFERQTGAFPQSPWAHAGKGRALEQLGRFSEALAAHDTAVSKAGADGTRFLAYRAFSLERAGQLENAVEAWKALLAKSPADPSARYGLGDALRRADRFDEAVAVLEEARKAAPGDPEPSYRIGLVRMDATQWDEAIAAFDAALAADAKMLEALCAASEACCARARRNAEKDSRALEEKDFDGAVSYAEKAAVAVAPESAYAHFTLAAAYEFRGEINADNFELSLKEYDAAIERIPIPGPAKVRALTARAFVLLRLGRWEEATDAAQRAIDIDKTCAAAWGHGGHAQAALGKPQDAVNRFYKPGMKACPGDARLLHDYGVALRELKKPNDARKPLEDARKADPKNGIYRLSLGELYYELGRFKDAMAELFEATELLPKDITAWRCYGRACYAGKQWEEAATAYEKVIELDPQSIEEHLYCAVIYADQLKDKAKAKPHIESFLKKGGQDQNLQEWMNQILEDAAKGK